MRIEQNDVCLAADSARAAVAEIPKFNHASRLADQIPAETSSQIADLAALPQALEQLAGILSGPL